MRRRRRAGFISVLLVCSCLFLSGPAARADEFRYGNIYWCSDPEGFQRPTTNKITFYVQIGKSLAAGQSIGDVIYERFDFGDGTSTLLPLTITEIHPDESWFLAQGEVVHQYSPAGDLYVYAGFEGCCRSDELNNRSGGPYRVKALVSRTVQSGWCTPKLFLPPVVSYYDGPPGESVDYVLPFFSSSAFLCQMSRDSEAGGGPSPSGMVLASPMSCILTWGRLSPPPPFPLWTAQVQVEGYVYHPDLFEFSILGGASVADFLVRFDTDVTPPVCQVESVDPGPPTRLFVHVQDPQSGLARIEVVEQDNATVSVPSHARDGFTGSVTVVGTKIDQGEAARVQLRVHDRSGNITDCDPVLTVVARATGRPDSQVFGDIPPEEHVVTVFNGDPGLRQLQIEVNGRKFLLAPLEPGEERTVDVASAIVPGVSSTFKLTSRGKPGGSATVMIWDGRSR